jgi:ABC-type transporter Mla subunit MlaD
MEAIASVTQQTASGTQQIARAAEDLNRLTETLQSLVNQFKLNTQNESGALSQNFQNSVETKRRLGYTVR